MKKLLAAVALILAAASVAEAAHPDTASTLPVRVVVVGFADRPIPAGAEALVCGTWVPAIQQWWVNEVNRTFISTCGAYTSPNPISAYGAQDDCGQGVSTGAFLNNLMVNELALHNTPLYRNWFVIVGGGGVAVAPGTIDSVNNFANAMVGDWGLTYGLTGQADSCCLTHNVWGPSGCLWPGASVFGHEALHTMTLSLSGPSTVDQSGTLWPDKIQPGDRALMLESSSAHWLYAPIPAPTITLPPTPTNTATATATNTPINTPTNTTTPTPTPALPGVCRRNPNHKKCG